MQKEKPIVNHNKEEPLAYKMTDLQRPSILYLYYVLNKEKEDRKEICKIIKEEIFEDKEEHSNIFIAKFNMFDKRDYVRKVRNMLHDRHEEDLPRSIPDLSDKLEDQIDAKSLIFMPVYNVLNKELHGIVSIQSKNENLFKANISDKIISLRDKIFKKGKTEKTIKTTSEEAFALIKDIIEKNILEYDNKVNTEIIEKTEKHRKELENKIAELEGNNIQVQIKNLNDTITEGFNKLLKEVKDIPNKAIIDKKHELYDKYLEVFNGFSETYRTIFIKYCSGLKPHEILPYLKTTIDKKSINTYLTNIRTAFKEIEYKEIEFEKDKAEKNFNDIDLLRVALILKNQEVLNFINTIHE